MEKNNKKSYVVYRATEQEMVTEAIELAMKIDEMQRRLDFMSNNNNVIMIDENDCLHKDLILCDEEVLKLNFTTSTNTVRKRII
jgi:hypothetical protein